MGTWFKGTDMWSCVWAGARLSLLLGVVVALIDTVLGIVIGAAWGYFKWLDPILIEFRNFVNNIPTLLLDILLMQMLMKYMSQYGFVIIVFLLCALGWLGLASFVRNQIIIIRNREYNIASQTLGSSSWTMISHNLLPYLISVIVTVVSTAIPEAISAEVGLAYFNLSFKISDGDITLGQVLTQAVKDNAWMSHPYLLLGPMIVMVPLTIAFFYLGLAISDATDPKSHR
ncbi:Oligopeptide transport system permease protein OppC [bioreactor metagenome]|uniref:Oligopeptide transport system permease protein OppC n=1 Tax=bioreactor metagenome TaxID=1076179 RepID=A0A645EYG6_9ZZZZ